MKNDDIEAARWYHRGTKHPGGPLLDPTHRYTAQDRPFLYKVYEGLEPIPLPLDTLDGDMAALLAVASEPPSPKGEQVPDLETVTRLLYFSAGITKRIDYGPPVGEIAFRAASCTGALFHIELYLACGDLPGLEAGVYHFDPRQNALRCLRKGDYRGHLVHATAEAEAVAQAPLILLYSDVFWRNAVKYQARAYRHAFWDSGMILSHTLALCVAYDLPAQVVMGFVDQEVNALLGLDGEWEAVLQLLLVGHTSEVALSAPELETLSVEVRPIVKDGRQLAERILEPIVEMHAASSLERAPQVAIWRGDLPDLPLAEPSRQPFALEPAAEEQLPGDPLEEVIKRRGSSRRFRREPITYGQLSTIMHRALHTFPADFTELPALNLSHVYLIVNAVVGLSPGSYVYYPRRQALELLQQGSFRQAAGALALGQALGRDASVNVYFLSDLAAVLQRFGNRGYRAAQLEASVAGGRIYLAAYAQELGATGLTFADDEVVDFFSPHAAGKSVLFLMAVGRPARRR